MATDSGQKFIRRNRALLLSEAGQAYLPGIRQAFDLLHEATERTNRSAGIGDQRVGGSREDHDPARPHRPRVLTRRRSRSQPARPFGPAR